MLSTYQHHRVSAACILMCDVYSAISLSVSLVISPGLLSSASVLALIDRPVTARGAVRTGKKLKRYAQQIFGRRRNTVVPMASWYWCGLNSGRTKACPLPKTLAFLFLSPCWDGAHMPLVAAAVAAGSTKGKECWLLGWKQCFGPVEGRLNGFLQAVRS